MPRTGNDSASREEADALAAPIRGLFASHAQWVDDGGRMHTLGPDDVLVITPNNARVRELLDLVPGGVRVGTFDKFQGQQAPLAIYSMATSSGDEAPRGMEFPSSGCRTSPRPSSLAAGPHAPA